MNKRAKRILITILFLVPGVAGTIGYLSVGQNFADSLYGAICLYLLSPFFQECPPLVELARWVAPIATASGIILAIRGLVAHIRNAIMAKMSHTTVIYADQNDQTMAKLAKKSKDVFLADYIPEGIRFYPAADDQMIVFSKDKDALTFYEKHKEALEQKRVFMKLDETNPYLLKSSDIHYFNTNEMIAENYWREYNLTSYLEKAIDANETIKVNIAIIGNGKMMQAMLNNALLLNIYDSRQQITYHVFGMPKDYVNLHENFDTMNDDQIIYYNESWTEHSDLLASCDRIIMLTPRTQFLEEVMLIAPDAELHVFSNAFQGYEQVYRFGHIKEFGNLDQIYTEENIKQEKHLEFAKKLNFHYACLYGDSNSDMETEWLKLDGFTKASNTTSTNYHEIRVMIAALCKDKEIEISEDTYSRLEHIRWCRFHFLNHWKYGIPENGKNKDAKRRIHVCLCPYDDLTEVDKSKDWESVQLLFSLDH